MKTENEVLSEVAKKFTIEGIINLPTENDILNITYSNHPSKGDVWKVKGKEIPDAHVKVLKEQAASFKQSELWRILKTELLWQSQERGLIKATSTTDLIVGKSLIYLTDILETKLSQMTR